MRLEQLKPTLPAEPEFLQRWWFLNDAGNILGYVFGRRKTLEAEWTWSAYLGGSLRVVGRENGFPRRCDARDALAERVRRAA